MDKKQYRELLSKLPIENPTVEDMAMLCPHLTKKQVAEIFDGRSGYIALPPLRVRHSFQVIHLQQQYDDEMKTRLHDGTLIVDKTRMPSRVRHAFASRTRQSYATDNLHGDVIYRYAYMAEAMKFAEDNWGDDLILDTWEDAVEFIITSHRDSRHGPTPQTKATLYICLNRSYNELINDHSKPQTVLIEEATSEITIDEMVWDELKGGRGIFLISDTEENTPLSKSMVRLLQESGYIFKQAPEVAERLELERYTERKRRAAEYKKSLQR